METALYFVMIILSILLIAVTLLQGKSDSFGGGMGGGSDSIYRTRRGFDKTVFNTTIILGVIWAVLAAVSSVIQ
ncbi:MAG: preprotein translocase subunit SecG [Thermomicrobiales bacterium]|nr:preprotein translocase subunit SecG [Thermomicrobiales bacterium]